MVPYSTATYLRLASQRILFACASPSSPLAATSRSPSSYPEPVLLLISTRPHMHDPSPGWGSTSARTSRCQILDKHYETIVVPSGEITVIIFADAGNSH